MMVKIRTVACCSGVADIVEKVGGPQPPLSLPASIVDSINKCDVDARRELYTGVVLTGGTSLMAGLRERLERTLAEVAPQASKVKVRMC